MNDEFDRIKGLQVQRQLLIEQVNALRKTLTLEDDPIRKVRYDTQLAEKEGELSRLELELQQLFSISTYTGKTILAQLIGQLGIGSPLGALHLVNCNREAQIDRFWAHYDALETHRFQFYALTSCETQKPGSFAERALYEFMGEELDEATDALYYRRDPKLQELGRPLIVDLPYGRNLASCQQKFRKHFAEFWRLGEQQTLEEYLRTGLPRSEYQAMALFFKLEAARWKPGVTLPYLAWIIDTLQTAHSDVPRVLVFLHINFTGAHQQADSLPGQPAYREIQQLIAEHEGIAHLLPFQPVPVADLKRWFRELDTRHTALLDKLIDTFSRGLDPHDQALFQQQQRFNMDDLELLQWEVYQHTNKLPA